MNVKNTVPSALGATLKSLRLYTVDDKGKEAFVERKTLSQPINKVMEIEDFYSYSQEDLLDIQK